MLAGAAIALSAERLIAPASLPARHERKLRIGLFVCMALAALPDADLLYQPIHRALTHSAGSTILITILAASVTGWVTGRRSIVFGLLCGVAWGSHVVLDWLGTDPTPPRGVQALWPFSDQWFISGLDIFRGTERRRLFSLASIVFNLQAVAQEIAIVGPIVAALFALRVSKNRRRARTLSRS